MFPFALISLRRLLGEKPLPPFSPCPFFLPQRHALFTLKQCWSCAPLSAGLNTSFLSFLARAVAVPTGSKYGGRPYLPPPVCPPPPRAGCAAFAHYLVGKNPHNSAPLFRSFNNLQPRWGCRREHRRGGLAPVPPRSLSGGARSLSLVWGARSPLTALRALRC